MGMISYDDIRQLQHYSSGPDSRVLSLYASVDQSNAANLNRGFQTAVESAFRHMAEGQLSANNKQGFDDECQRVLRFLMTYTPRGKGIVIFSDSSRDFWWQRDLQVELSTEVRWSPSPWVRPLLEVVEEHDRFAAVLMDKQRARILTVDAIGLQQHAEILSDTPNRHVTTGTDHIWSQMQMERDHDKHVKWHATRVIEELSNIVDRFKITRLVIGGPVEATSLFINELPKRLQQMIIGTVSVPLEAGYDRLVEELRAVQERAEQEDEVKLVEAMITAAHKHDRAVLGITDTLEAIEEGRVYCMVVAKDYHVEGTQCTVCRVLSVSALEACSFCDGKLEPAIDLINRASHKVLEQAGRVQVVSGKATEKLARARIGAVLRF
jgi:peptide chain release factor subunit 1